MNEACTIAIHGADVRCHVILVPETDTRISEGNFIPRICLN